MKKYAPGGDLNPNSKVNVKPGFGKGEPGGAPIKSATPPIAAQSPRRAASDGISGIDRALSAHADKMHPVAKSQTAKRASPVANDFNDEQ